ncbi:hypothetical protein LVY72_12300 [Arthrobacter sp. I2-34]|uniref:Pilus assembly protein n=1 Tax=Arthrobacter hankyongi TaxID=2904801 RepID=A0ABS9L7R5_9MICC|nr:hypothetical protein [Arthrobacter hankyongi]MCG2622685.1 hypothetical protein [Arthrobacter hankyongi]
MRRCRGDAGGVLSGLRERLAGALLPDEGSRSECGSAVVEFLFLGTLLLVPVVYFIVGIGQVQAGSFAVVSAADHAAKVFAAAHSPAEGRARAEQAVLVSAQDFGFDGGRLRVDARCSADPCLEPGSAVTVDVSLEVPLPFLAGLDLSAVQVSSTATQIVGRFR